MDLIIWMSDCESFVLEFVGPRPSENSTASNEYNMIEFGSNFVAEIPFGGWVGCRRCAVEVAKHVLAPAVEDIE